MNIAQNYYSTLLDDASKRVSVLSKKSLTISTLRLAIFIASVGMLWLLWGNWFAIIIIIIIAIVAFLILIKKHEKLYNARVLEEAKIEIANDNINRMQLNLEKGTAGTEYIDSRHQYSYDLDLFGKYSIFSLLNTTATTGGAEILANWLTTPKNIRTRISQHQESINELSQLSAFRTLFRAHGIVARDDIKHNANTPFSDIPSFKISAFHRVLIHAVPIIMILLIVLCAFGMISGSIIGLFFFFSLSISVSGFKKVSFLHRKLDNLTNKISAYNTLFAQVENLQFESSLLKELQYGLTADGCKASIATEYIAKVLNNLNQRYNWLSYVILNGFLMWDYRQLNNVDKLMSQYSKHFEGWHNSLSYIDALSSLGTFGFNNPKYSFPTLDVKGETIIAGKDFTHPLIPATRCVSNGIKTMSRGDFMVVTGANMAGKSTYLRTIGVNYLLALIGAPVAVHEMVFTPVELFTGLRTTDSLQDNESYFFAELRRLQTIVEIAKSGEPIFVILDEILKGTNSVDKQKGSLALIRKFVSMHTTGIIATHDLMLGSLADEFPNNVSNYCFEAEIKDDTLTFSYKIQEGIAQNMNAYFLMQRMGIV